MRCFYKKFGLPLLVMTCVLGCACSEKENENTVVKPSSGGLGEGNGGYLFAHMTNAAYGQLFYSVSRDGKDWIMLNNRNVVHSQYRGHPDICEGPVVEDLQSADRDRNGKLWYMVGVDLSKSPIEVRPPVLWYSDDLITWKKKDIDASVMHVGHLSMTFSNIKRTDDGGNVIPNVSSSGIASGKLYNEGYLGAPKLYFDEDSGRFLITWHASLMPNQSQAHWETMTTVYTLTEDFESFTPAKVLFDADSDGSLEFTGDDANIATIDVIIRKIGERYYAIVKDERWPDKYPSYGKRIRVAESDNMLGPYSELMPTFNQNWREAPIFVISPEGKVRIYVEDYGNHQYECYEAGALVGEQWRKLQFTPPVARHGCIVHVDEQTLQGIWNAYK